MKWLLTLLVLTLNLQPLQVAACDMEPAQNTGHHAQLDDEHPGECCDGETETLLHECAQVSHCGSCTAAMFLQSARPPGVLSAPGSFVRSLAAGQLPPSHSSPPFRPPIS